MATLWQCHTTFVLFRTNVVQKWCDGDAMAVSYPFCPFSNKCVAKMVRCRHHGNFLRHLAISTRTCYENGATVTPWPCHTTFVRFRTDAVQKWCDDDAMAISYHIGPFSNQCGTNMVRCRRHGNFVSHLAISKTNVVGK